MVSVGHCGNHKQNLVDNSVMASVDMSVIDAMAIGSAFFKMGGNYLRLFYDLPRFVSDHTALPVVGEVPPLAARVADQLQDYSTKNYKAPRLVSISLCAISVYVSML